MVYCAGCYKGQGAQPTSSLNSQSKMENDLGYKMRAIYTPQIKDLEVLATEEEQKWTWGKGKRETG